MTLLVAPTERPPISSLGPYSSLPERMGVDIIWESRNGLAGCQRKAYCVAPQTRVLTAGLEWVPISKVSLGDILMGFDEHKDGHNARRHWKAAEVLAVTPVTLPSYRLVFDDGTEVISSSDHRWLTFHATVTQWTATKNLFCAPNKKSRLLRVSDVWEEAQGREAGYLAAAFDGEGNLCQIPSRGNGHFCQLIFGQTENEMLSTVLRYLDHFGFSYTHAVRANPPGKNWKEFFIIRIAPRREALRFLGTIRPQRLLPKFNPDLVGQVYSKPRFNPVVLVKKEFIGTTELVGLTTSTGTFVAEGLASHNSDLIASVRDGRLGRELEQMQTGLSAAFVVIEGQPSWDREGNLSTPHTRWTLKQHNGVLLSIQTKGVPVLTSRNALETCAVIEHLVEWTNRDDHVSSLLARPKPSRNGWGRLDDRATAIHIYSGIPSVGPELAARIYDAGLRLLVRGVTEEQLLTVRGIGKTKAAAIIRSVGT